MPETTETLHDRLAVVVPVRNEASLIGACLASLAAQAADLSVFVSDNASTDGTAEVAAAARGSLDLTIRTIEPLPACVHFVSAMRWALASTDAAYFAILAGDDSWLPGFAEAALDGRRGLRRFPAADVVFPSFTWGSAQDGTGSRPPSFLQRSPARRQLVALVLPDYRELANVLYGVFRRSAFETLADEWEKGGDDFGSDYAAAWALLARHPVVGVPEAHGLRSVRGGVDLLERVGHSRRQARGPLGTVLAYVRLNLDINNQLAAALRRVSGRDGTPPTWQVQVVRAPQWLWGAVGQVLSVVRGRQAG